MIFKRGDYVKQSFKQNSSNKYSSNIATYIGATVRWFANFGEFLHGYDALVDFCMIVLMKEDTTHTINDCVEEWGKSQTSQPVLI